LENRGKHLVKKSRERRSKKNDMTSHYQIIS